jgi:hypothetical protein
MDKGENLTEHPLERMGSWDFVRGILYYSARRRGGTFYYDVNETKLHTAFKAAFDLLREKAETEDLRLTFFIAPHPMHGDSEILTTELCQLLYSREAEGVYGSYVRLIYHADYDIAEHMAGLLPGSPELYEELTDTFLNTYEGRPEA